MTEILCVFVSVRRSHYTLGDFGLLRYSPSQRTATLALGHITMRLTLLIFGLFLAAMPAHAKSLTDDLKSHGEKFNTDTMRLDVMGVIAMSTIGGAAWLVVPVAPKGFVEGLDDSFELEGGGYVAWHSGGANYISIVPAIGAKWSFHVTKVLTTFVTARAGLEVGIAEDVLQLTGGGSLGTYWHVGEGVDLRFEVGYPYLGMLGVSLPF